MDFKAFLTWARSAIAALFSHLAVARLWLAGWGGRVRRSFVALVASPAVWLACGVIGFAGWWGGYQTAAIGKRAARAELAEARRETAGAIQAAETASEAAAAAKAEAASARGKVAALQNEIDALRNPAGGPSAAAGASPPRKAVPKKKAAVAAPQVPFWPFSN